VTDIELFGRLGMALAVGMLIGLERGWHERTEKGGGLAVSAAGHGITLAAMVNTLVKAGITAVLGGKRLALETSLPLLLTVLVGAMVLMNP